jgi:hypothetical protein
MRVFYVSSSSTTSLLILNCRHSRRHRDGTETNNWTAKIEYDFIGLPDRQITDIPEGPSRANSDWCGTEEMADQGHLIRHQLFSPG